MEGNAQHEAALRKYLDRGGNLIDTSANYGDGQSEVLVGRVLQDYPRDQVIVVTKGGYIQGRNMALARRREFPEVVHYGDGIWHSIHPEFLETQITMSLERMKQDMADVYLLHNPEYFLEDQAHHKPVGDAERDEFYRRVREAFRYLEEQVSKGRIRWYGISSNNFPAPASAPTQTSVERCWQAAESVSPEHHFRVVQLPLNLYESGGALELNNGGKTVLAFAKEKGLGVLLNRPLNAFFSNRMIRLADFLPVGQPPPGVEQLQKILEPVWLMEKELAEQHGIPLLYGEGKGIAHYLGTIVPQVKSPAQWEQAFYEYVVMPIERWATECQQLYGDGPEGADWTSWWDRFSKALPAALEEVGRYVGSAQQAVSDEIRAQVEQAGYPPTRESLSRIANNILLSLEGVSCVLVGMRRPEYVEDTMGAVALGHVDSLAILSRFRQMVASPQASAIQ
jgi:aryl-alcohol dehydrogenase-like predicted oxidoreductase